MREKRNFKTFAYLIFLTTAPVAKRRRKKLSFIGIQKRKKDKKIKALLTAFLMKRMHVC